MNKSLFLLLILISNICYSQFTNREKNTIRINYIIAQNLYSDGDYEGSLKKILETEKVIHPRVSAKLQNLKVKVLVARKEYQDAHEQLNLLKDLDLTDDVIKDISFYVLEIEKGLSELEKEKKKLDSIHLMMDKLEKAKKESQKKIYYTNKRFENYIIGYKKILFSKKYFFLFNIDNEHDNNLSLLNGNKSVYLDDYFIYHLSSESENEDNFKIDGNDMIVFVEWTRSKRRGKHEVIIINKKNGKLYHYVEKIVLLTNYSGNKIYSYRVHQKNSKIVGFFNLSPNGFHFIEPKYEKIGISLESDDINVFFAKKNGKWGLLNFSGNIIVPFALDGEDSTYDKTTWLNGDKDYWHWISFKGKDYRMNARGQLVNRKGKTSKKSIKDLIQEKL